MAKVLNEHYLNKLLRDYILELASSGEYIPEWLFDAKFCFDKTMTDCVANLNAESNKIVYGKSSTPHSIIHELEHLRSRHRELVKGYDDEFEKFVYFYFVGYRTSGCNGLFLEEALNELSARKIGLAMFGDTIKQRRKLVTEYKTQNYYNFEIYTTIALCSMLGVKVEDVRKMKFSGDTTGQDSLKQVVDFMAGRKGYWSAMQDKLDDYEFAKRLPMFGETRREMQKEALMAYYKLAYHLMINAYDNKMLNSAEVGRAIYLFETYSKRAGDYCKFAESARLEARQSVVAMDKFNAKVLANGERCVVKNEAEKQYAVVLPRGSGVVSGKVAKKIFDNFGNVFLRQNRYEMLQEAVYGL